MNTILRNIPFSPPDMTTSEVSEVSDALRSGWITTGPRTKTFERQLSNYCHTGTTVCLNSATACMELALRVLGVGPGDEVITSAYTYTATASVTCHVGAKVVLVDTAPDSYEMDYDKLCAAITERTKVVMVDRLRPIGCSDPPMKRFVSMRFSAVRISRLFHAVKNLTTAEGGALRGVIFPGHRQRMALQTIPAPFAARPK